jgi:outer membrane biogenesis lipoprotein LolB
MRNLAVLCAAALLAACTHTPVTPSGTAAKTDELTTDRFWDEQRVRAAETSQISAKVKVTYQGKRGKKISGNGRLVLQPDTKVRLELRDPLGRIHYLAALSGHKFVAHYPRQKLAYLDERSGGAYISDFLGIDFTFSELHSLLLGILPERFSHSAFDTWYFDKETKAYKGLLTAAEYRVTCTVDPVTAALKGLELSSPAGRIALDYSVFEPCCHGIAASRSSRVAQVVDLTLDRARTALAIEWEKISPLEEARPEDIFRLEIPEQDQKIVLK